jgi:hypothetical protein
MSELENFLTRWSRRKRTVTEQDGEQAATSSAEPVAGDDKVSQSRAPTAPSETNPPMIDLATLPPIESIGAGSNIGVFLQAGVPTEMTRAALRRAWATDPTIRDFVGLAENAWDFTAPDAMPGFGPLSTADASRAMAQLTGKASEALERLARSDDVPTEPAQIELAPSKSIPPPIGDDNKNKKIAGPAQDQPEQKPNIFSGALNSAQHDKENIAPQYNISGPDGGAHPIHRTHGRALPK